MGRMYEQKDVQTAVILYSPHWKWRGLTNFSDLGKRSQNVLDFWYSHGFIKSFSWLLLPALTSKAATVSEKSILFTFSPIDKPMLQNLTLPSNRLSSIQGHYLNKLCWALGPWCYTPTFKAIGLLVPEKKTFEGILPYMAMAASLVLWPNLYSFHFLASRSFQIKFGFKWPSHFWEKRTWYQSGLGPRSRNYLWYSRSLI